MPTTTSVQSDLHNEVLGSGPPVLFISGASGDAGQDGAPQLIRATARFAEQLGVAVAPIAGHHAPSLQRPEAFAEELRPILRELV